MKVYFAGGEERAKVFNDTKVERALFSFYRIFECHNPKTFLHKMEQTPVVDVFLDSGAFSAMTKGVKIDLQEYIHYCHEYSDRLTAYANLDVIGDPSGSMKNLEKMKGAGLNPVPVFHYGSPLSVLDEMVSSNDYLALGGLVPLKGKKDKLKAWLDRCFSCIRDRTKAHGFGVTNFSLLCRYPFHSVDSTSWLSGQQRGVIYTFEGGKLKSHDTTGATISTPVAVFKDFDGQKNWYLRTCQNAKTFQKVEQFVTDLWASRGIKT